MTTTRYKGFTILSRPYQLHRSRQWTADLAIKRHYRLQSFPVAARYHTEDEADEQAAGLGRRIIDGGVPGRLVRVMRSRSPRAEALVRYWDAMSTLRLAVGGGAAIAFGILLLLAGADLIPPVLGRASVLLGLGFIGVGLGKRAAALRETWAAGRRHQAPTRPRTRRSTGLGHHSSERSILPHHHAH